MSEPNPYDPPQTIEARPRGFSPKTVLILTPLAVLSTLVATITAAYDALHDRATENIALIAVCAPPVLVLIPMVWWLARANRREVLARSTSDDALAKRRSSDSIKDANP